MGFEYSQVFNPDQLIRGKKGAANNYAEGYYGKGISKK